MAEHPIIFGAESARVVPLSIVAWAHARPPASMPGEPYRHGYRDDWTRWYGLDATGRIVGEWARPHGVPWRLP